MIDSRTLLRYAMVHGLEVHDSWTGYDVPTPLRMGLYDYVYERVAGEYAVATYPSDTTYLRLMTAATGSVVADLRALYDSEVVYSTRSYAYLVASDPQACGALSFAPNYHFTSGPVSTAGGYVLGGSALAPVPDSYLPELEISRFTNLNALP